MWDFLGRFFALVLFILLLALIMSAAEHFVPQMPDLSFIAGWLTCWMTYRVFPRRASADV